MTSARSMGSHFVTLEITEYQYEMGSHWACTCHTLYVLQWPEDGRITAETCRHYVINITYLYRLRIVVLQTVHTVLLCYRRSILYCCVTDDPYGIVVLQTVHTVLFTVRQRDGLYQILHFSLIPFILLMWGSLYFSASVSTESVENMLYSKGLT
jgi:hypothetical protein